MRNAERGAASEWSDRWIGGAGWHWTTAVCGCNMCATHAHTHSDVATWRSDLDCLFVRCSLLFSYLFISFASAAASFCDLKLLYYFALISNFLRIIFVLFIYSRRDLYNTSAHVSAGLMWRIMEPHSFSYARIMQSNARGLLNGARRLLGCLAAGLLGTVLQPIKVNKLQRNPGAYKTICLQREPGPKPFWTAI